MAQMRRPNPNSPVVLVDMDGVLSGFETELASRAFALNPNIVFNAPRTNFYFSDDYPEHADLLKSIPREVGFFESLPVIDNALDGWQRIIDYGYLPRICSSPIGTEHCPGEKRRWLEQHFVPVFGSWVVEQMIITKNKAEHDGIVLIDDKPFIKGADKASWTHIVFDRPYNTESPQPRLMGWRDPNLQLLLDQFAKK